MMKFTPSIFMVCLLMAATAAFAETKEQPVPVRIVAPDYPTEMHRAGISGLVTVKCTIDEHGDVVETEVVKCSDHAFEAPALAAVQKWKFKPATLDNKPITVKVLIPVKFVFEG